MHQLTSATNHARAALLIFSVSLVLGGCQSSSPPSASNEIAVKQVATPALGGTFEPAKGVTCRNSTSLCNWRGGPSVGLTRLFFGEAAAIAARPQVEAAHFPNDPIFKPNPNASCDTLVTTCYDSGGASTELTSQYFGTEAARLLGERNSKVVRYGAHVTCDQTTRICYDRFGAGVGITQLYIGRAESDALLARLRARDS